MLQSGSSLLPNKGTDQITPLLPPSSAGSLRSSNEHRMYPEAEAFYQRALALEERVLGSDASGRDRNAARVHLRVRRLFHGFPWGLNPAPIMLTFPQASRRSRAAVFPRLGSDLGISSARLPVPDEV